jgi:hypothetical protein
VPFLGNFSTEHVRGGRLFVARTALMKTRPADAATSKTIAESINAEIEKLLRGAAIFNES